MKTENTVANGRRKALKAIGGTAFAITVAGLSACSGEDSGSEQRGSGNDALSRAESDAADNAETAAKEAMDAMESEETAQSAASDGPNLPHLAEADPQAQALSYVDDASSVDSAAQPRYEVGQNCLNCSLYTGRDGDAWGPCSIFPGKAVSAAGWCSVYAPKA